MTSIREIGQNISRIRVSRRQAIGMVLGAGALTALEGCGTQSTPVPTSKPVEMPKPLFLDRVVEVTRVVEKVVIATAEPAKPIAPSLAEATATAKPTAEAAKPVVLAQASQDATGKVELSASQ